MKDDGEPDRPGDAARDASVIDASAAAAAARDAMRTTRVGARRCLSSARAGE
jgi:hypothetical protein